MKDNHLPNALYLFTYSIIALFVLSFIPPFNVGKYTFKEVNLISDLEPDLQEIIIPVDTVPDIDSLIDSVIIELPPVVVKIDTCKNGIICLEDYSQDKNIMEAFITSLDAVKSSPVRIAFYGDSFIEGDILTSSLRDTLQRVFGGRGVGFVPITSEVARFRTTIKHTFSNWNTHSIVSTYEEDEEKPTFGIAGYCVEPLEDNVVQYSPVYGASLNRLSIFYTSQTIRKLNYVIRDSISIDTTLYPLTGLRKLDLINLRSKSIKISITEPDSIQLYGVAIEDYAGIYVDNLAMRGNSGIGLSQISNSMLQASNRLRPYHLVILQFGLNVVTEDDSTQYLGYAKSMTRIVDKFKESLPDCSILVVSVSDRSSNQDGEFKTIPGILAMRNAQRLVAKKSGVAFWDLLEAMGGENSMPKFVNAKPSMAGKDYTHLNFRGGKFVAQRLANALLYEKEKYEKSKSDL